MKIALRRIARVASCAACALSISSLLLFAPASGSATEPTRLTDAEMASVSAGGIRRVGTPRVEFLNLSLGVSSKAVIHSANIWSVHKDHVANTQRWHDRVVPFTMPWSTFRDIRPWKPMVPDSGSWFKGLF